MVLDPGSSVPVTVTPPVVPPEPSRVAPLWTVTDAAPKAVALPSWSVPRLTLKMVPLVSPPEAALAITVPGPVRERDAADPPSVIGPRVTTPGPLLVVLTFRVSYSVNDVLPYAKPSAALMWKAR